MKNLNPTRGLVRVLLPLAVTLLVGSACGGEEPGPASNEELVDDTSAPDGADALSADEIGTTSRGLEACLANVPFAPHCHPDLTEGCCWTGYAPICLAGCPAGFDAVCKSKDGDGNFNTCAVGTHKYCCTH